MKKIIGSMIGYIGAKMWRIGGWTGSEKYEDLNRTGRIGYAIMCKGIKMLGYNVGIYK